MEAIHLRECSACNVAHDHDFQRWSTSVKSLWVGRPPDGLKAAKSINHDDDQSGQSGWMFAQMQTPIPWISIASRHVVDGAGHRDLRSVVDVVSACHMALQLHPVVGVLLRSKANLASI